MLRGRIDEVLSAAPPDVEVHPAGAFCAPLSMAHDAPRRWKRGHVSLLSRKVLTPRCASQFRRTWYPRADMWTRQTRYLSYMNMIMRSPGLCRLLGWHFTKRSYAYLTSWLLNGHNAIICRFARPRHLSRRREQRWRRPAFGTASGGGSDSARKHLRQLLVGDHSPHRNRRGLAPQGAPRAGPLLDQLYGECSAEQDRHVVDRHLG